MTRVGGGGQKRCRRDWNHNRGKFMNLNDNLQKVPEKTD